MSVRPIIVKRKLLETLAFGKERPRRLCLMSKASGWNSRTNGLKLWCPWTGITDMPSRSAARRRRGFHQTVDGVQVKVRDVGRNPELDVPCGLMKRSAPRPLS